MSKQADNDKHSDMDSSAMMPAATSAQEPIITADASRDKRIKTHRVKPGTDKKTLSLATLFSLLIHFSFFALLVYMVYPFIASAPQSQSSRPKSVEASFYNSMEDYRKANFPDAKPQESKAIRNDKPAKATQPAAQPVKQPGKQPVRNAPPRKPDAANSPVRQPQASRGHNARRYRAKAISEAKITSKTRQARRTRKAAKSRSRTNQPNKVSHVNTSKHVSDTRLTSANTGSRSRPPLYGIGSRLNPYPPYPEEARYYGLEGKMRLRVWVSAKGKTDKIKVEKSTGYPVLDNAAVQTIKRWRFEPALANGIQVAGQTTIPIRFELKNTRR